MATTDVSRYWGYWKYFSDDFSWTSESRSARLPNAKRSVERFTDLGMSEDEADAYVRSGYVVNDISDTVIDRYYGGLLPSYDLRSRFPIRDFLARDATFKRDVKVFNAHSMGELREFVGECATSSRRALLFRGQTGHFRLSRGIDNSTFVVDGFGEPSLIPSVWRRMLQATPLAYPEFEGLSNLEWSRVIYSQFDMEDVERRQRAINESGGWVHTIAEMEDCDDPVVSAFGKLRGDLLLGNPVELPVRLNTLLQHYGLDSPMLDLTDDVEVALFFATHRFRGPANAAEYEFVGTNGGQSLLYVFGYDQREMRPHFRDPALGQFNPLRPARQSCYVCTSNAYSINLAADFLLAIIKLDFDDAAPGPLTVAHLFPPPAEDCFLQALLDKTLHPDRITVFR